MKVYLDLVIFLNFFFDFLLIFSVSLILKRKVSLFRFFIASLIASSTVLSLFYPFSSLELFLFKMCISVLMVLVSFGYHDLKYMLKNLFYLYVSSIFLGGSLYLLNVQFSYENNGLIFYHQGLSINLIVILIITPVIIFLHIRQSRGLKNNYANYYKVEIYLKNRQVIKTTAFLDTGNGLVDPYRNRPIILVDEKLISGESKILLVPYHSLNHQNLLRCIVPDKIYIENVGFKTNFLIGLSKEKFVFDGVDCILNSKLLERMN